VTPLNVPEDKKFPLLPDRPIPSRLTIRAFIAPLSDGEIRTFNATHQVAAVSSRLVSANNENRLQMTGSCASHR
jgi:hypothetical protein